MLILPNSCFLHVPKTGGSWVKKAIIASAIDVEDYRIDGNPHIGLADCPCPEKFKFAFVRHPVQLYRSYWRFKMGLGWDPKNPLDNACRSENFQQFIRNILAKYPGVLGKNLNQFVGEAGNEIDFIGKYENLVEDLISALTMAGEVFDAEAIRKTAPYNVSSKARFSAQYTAELEKAIKQAESDVMQRFGYT